MRYTQQEVTLEKGDFLYLYTDGVTEATDENLNLYKEHRLLTVMNKSNAECAKTLLEEVKEDVDGFANGTDQFDDITMLGVIYNPE